MQKYTVKDTATGKNVTFSWEGSEAPTDKDMTEIFAESRTQKTGKVGTKDWLPESYGGVPKWGLKNPKLWGVRGAGLALYDAAVQPTLEALGMVAGSFGSPVVGTALGYGAGKKTGEMVRGGLSRMGMPEDLQQKQRGVTQELVRSAVDVAEPLVVGAAFSKTAKIIQPIDDKITAAIKKGIEKGVRPTVVGKRTFGQVQQYAKQSESAVKSIVENKNNLRLTDEFGDPSPGLPKNLRQFSEAIDQTKKGVFKQYDSMAKLAGEKGAVVSLDGVVKELRSFANQKSMKLASPGVVKYANELIKRSISHETKTVLGKTVSPKKLTTKQAQEAVAILNDGLQAFYKNPSYNTARKAYVDQMVVNKLRKSLDDVILKSTGKHYQVLKNKYGSLKSIEREVNHRAVVDARKNVKGLLDFSDVFTGYHAAKGILSLDPATIGAAGTGKAVAWLYRTKNQPNRMVKNMFSDVERLMNKLQKSH